MRSRILPVVGIGALALVATSAFAPGANASHSVAAKHPAAALSMTHHGKVAVPTGSAGKGGKCGTAIGTPTLPDGIISVNNSAGTDVAGAADFKCPKKKGKRTFKSVTVNGYFGDPGSTQFNVTVYADKGGEPDNGSAPVCATQTATGTPTGASYPTNDTTVIALGTPCVAKKGTNWIEVQAQTGNVWYWETQTEVGGSYPADWRDATGIYGTGCTPGYQDGLYMEDCIFGGPTGENDFMFTIK